MRPLALEPAPPAVPLRTWQLLSLWLIAFGLCLLVQGAWRSPGAEFWHADDGAHYVSSAMIANWLSTGMGSPMGAALGYNGHYPLVGIGLWGPAFYGIFGAAIAVLGGGQAVALALTAAVFASLAALTAWAVARVAAPLLACVAAVLVVLLPLCVDQSLAFGLDAPVAVGICGAAFALGRWLFTGSRIALGLFVVMALVGLLTKGNALALYLFGPLVLALARKPRALLDWRFLLAAIVVTAIALPWYLFSYGLTSQGFRAAWGWAFTSQALVVNLQLLYGTTGPIVLAFAAWGAWLALRNGGLGAVSLAGALSVYLFQSIVPASLNARYLLPMLPFVLVLAALGAQAAWSALAARLAGVPQRALVAGFMLVVTGASVALLSYPPVKAYHGFGGAAAEARRLLTANNRTVLIVGFDVVETTFIAETAMLQPVKPDLHIIRGSRLLGGGGYNNFDYAPRFSSVDDVAAELVPYRVPVIVISTADRASRWAHVAQVQALLDRPASGWRLAWTGKGTDDVRIYVNDAHAQQPGAAALVRKLSAPRREGLPG
jgi:hypothetical protein